MLERIFSRTGSPRTWELLNGRWMADLYSSSVGLHIVALIPIRQYFSWFNFLRSEWNIESENLLDEVTNLGIFTIWLATSGCWPHMSSVWPWSGAPKVHLYNTFLGRLCQNATFGSTCCLVVCWGWPSWVRSFTQSCCSNLCDGGHLWLGAWRNYFEAWVPWAFAYLVEENLTECPVRQLYVESLSVWLGLLPVEVAPCSNLYIHPLGHQLCFRGIWNDCINLS